MSESIADLKAHIERLKGERSTLRLQMKALKKGCRYYADGENWTNDDWGVKAVIGEYGNAGKTARDALAAAASVGKVAT